MAALTSDQRAEIERAIATNRATQDALAEDQVAGQAEITIRLAQSSGEPPWQSPEYQRELRHFAEALRGEGLAVSSRVRMHDAVDGGTWLLGEFIIPLIQIAAPAVAGVVGAWLHAKVGRKARIEFYADGKVKRAEAQTPEQVIALIEAARREAQPRPKRQPK